MNDERARLFVALELPVEVRTAIAQWARTLPASGLRLVSAEMFHVTLCFLGWIASEEIPRIAQSLEVLAQRRRVVLAVAEPRWLPRRRPRVLAVELAERRGALDEIQATASKILHAGGWYEPEDRPFLAHVTVARVQRGARAPRVSLSAPPALGFHASAVALWQSRLGPAGPRYTPVHTVELGA